MLTLSGKRSYHECDRHTRRDFLKIGALGASTLGLPQLLAARSAAAAAGKPRKNTSVVWVWLQGGPSQLETFDPKIDIASEYRSTSGAIPTALPGVRFGGLYPKTAAVADKLAIVRTMSHTSSNHKSGTHFVMTGYDNGELTNAEGPQTRPSLGSITSYARGANHPQTGVPTYVSLRPAGKSIIEYDGPLYLGAANRPFYPSEETLGSMTLQTSLERLDDRRSLLANLDRLKRELDSSGQMRGHDAFQEQALDLVLRGARDAFDWKLEDPRTIEKYGEGIGRRFLLARRLCESGCGFVTIKDGSWDFHGPEQNGTIKEGMARRSPALDNAIATFIEDVHERGLEEEILLVITGDFGRTPKINRVGGRDHWPAVCTLALSGGGLTMGQVIGETDAKAAFPISRLLSPQDLMATIFHTLGIDLNLEFTNYSGGPVSMVETGQPIGQLL